MKDLQTDRNSSIERLLRRQLEGRGAADSTDACLTAETLAAWADDALTARERSLAETHAADCVRCQALVAAMARTTPMAAARQWWRLPQVRWLAPALAVGFALVVWAMLPNRRAFDATDRGAPPSASAATSSASTPSSSAVAAPPAPAESETMNRTASSNVRQGPTTPQATVREGRADAKRDESAESRGKQEAATARVDSLEERVTIPSPEPPAKPQSAAAGGAPVSAPAAVGRTAAQTREALADSSSVRTFAAKAVSVPNVIVSPDPSSRWRLASGDAVARSTDGGSTWQMQTTGVPATLTAGSAPSPLVCWLVGRSGVVLLSIDGGSWRSVQFPAAVDLVRVQATDDKTATVTASDRRTFTTKDGGVTWARP